MLPLPTSIDNTQSAHTQSAHPIRAEVKAAGLRRRQGYDSRCPDAHGGDTGRHAAVTAGMEESE